MAELQIYYDRYDGVAVAAQVEPEFLRLTEDEAFIEVPLGDNEDFALYFEARNGHVEPVLFNVAKHLMGAIGHLDNLVQESSVETCKRSGLHPRNYEGMLGYVRVDRDRALLRYWGTGVNTEWDELVRLENGAWNYVGTVPPK